MEVHYIVGVIVIYHWWIHDFDTLRVYEKIIKLLLFFQVKTILNTDYKVALPKKCSNSNIIVIFDLSCPLGNDQL